MEWALLSLAVALLAVGQILLRSKVADLQARQEAVEAWIKAQYGDYVLDANKWPEA